MKYFKMIVMGLILILIMPSRIVSASTTGGDGNVIQYVPKCPVHGPAHKPDNVIADTFVFKKDTQYYDYSKVRCNCGAEVNIADVNRVSYYWINEDRIKNIYKGYELYNVGTPRGFYLGKPLYWTLSTSSYDDIPDHGWANIEGKRFYIKNDGQVATGINQVGTEWYYFKEDGVMQTGWQYIGNLWFYFNASGVMQTGWKDIGGTWYYLDSAGVMQTGWKYIGTSWYYFNTSGAMQTGWVDPNADWYYLKGDGSMQIGWYLEGSNWFFLNDSSDRGPIGKMLKEWAYINGAWYYFNGSGIMQTGWLNHNGTWYYLNSNGAMRTEPLTENGKTYYFASNGACTNP